MSRYEAGSNPKHWWIYSPTPGAWVASPPVLAGLRVETFPTHREAMGHYIRHQRSLAANRLAQLLVGGAA